MKVTKYNLLLNEEGVNVLVKESSRYCSSVSCLDSPINIVHMMNTIYDAERLPDEHVWMLALNSQLKLIGTFEVAHGLVDKCMIGQKEIYVRACVSGASAIVMVHNHPSGELLPSEADDDFTKKISEAGKLMGIQLIDHIIIGAYTGYYSYRHAENRILKG